MFKGIILLCTLLLLLFRMRTAREIDSIVEKVAMIRKDFLKIKNIYIKPIERFDMLE